MTTAAHEQRVVGDGADVEISFSQEPRIVVRENEPEAIPSRFPANIIPSHLGFFRGCFHFTAEFVKTGLVAVCWLVTSSVRYLRYHPTHALFTGAMFGVLFLLLVTGSKMHDRLILSEISDTTLDNIIGASRFTREYESDQFLRVGAPRWAQRESVRAILFHARKAGLPLSDQAVLLATAEIESGFNPMARAGTTTACGLFQFVRDTGRMFGLSAEQCMDPWLNAQTGVQHYLSAYDRVRKSVEHLDGPERLFKTFELSYYLHHDGLASSNPADDLKATVLGGVQFLFHVHTQLEREEASKGRAPTFTQAFAEDIWETLTPVVRLVRDDAVGIFGAETAVAENGPQA